MADERTERATPKRQQQVRSEGNIPKSQDLSQAVMLTIALYLIMIYAPSISTKLQTVTVYSLTHLNPESLNRGNFVGFFAPYIGILMDILLPIFFILMIAGLAVQYFQVGFLFTLKPITPTMEKISPKMMIQGFKRLLPNVKNLVELFKQFLKLLVVGGVCFSVINSRKQEILALLGADIALSLKVISDVIMQLFTQVCVVLIIIGIIDRIYQKYEFEKSIKMTKQEVKDEKKNVEGDPAIKAKIKGWQMKFAQQRMMGAVPTADVIVTNPTHYAIAIRYDTSKAPAPQVVAKGVDFLAFKIREIAESNGIPIVEDKPLARTLYKIVPLEGLIPAELYVAVAEVLAYVYKSGKGKK